MTRFFVVVGAIALFAYAAASPPPPPLPSQLVLHLELTPRASGKLFTNETPLSRFSAPISATPLASDTFTPAGPASNPVARIAVDTYAGAELLKKQPGNPPGTSPPYKLRFDPQAEGVDPMIAVGEKYVVVTQDHWISFLDKTGKPLPQKNNLLTSLASSTLFDAFISPSQPYSSKNINNYTGIPPDSSYQCNANASPVQFPCVLDFYDTRVLYEPVGKRFIILSGARTDKNIADQHHELKPENFPSFFAFAVSKTEDPRDGFHMYMSTWSRYGNDFPEIAVGNKSFVVGDLTTYQARAATVFWLTDIENGVDNPRYFDLMKTDFGCTTYACVTPVQAYESSEGMTYFLKYPQKAGDPLEIKAFPIPSNPQVAPPLVTASVALDTPVGGLASVVYRNNKIHLTTRIVDSLRVPGVQPKRVSVRIVRIPVHRLADGSISVSKSNVDGFLDGFFGTRSADDAPTDLVGFELPAVSANKNGDMLFVYGRYPVKTAKPLFQEIRYTLIPHDKGMLESAVLKPGETQMISIESGETTPVPMSYNEVSGRFVETASVVVDPSDDLTFWMIHRYARLVSGARTWATYAGAVKP